MTVDAVGGAWRYAMDLGRSLRDVGIGIVFAGQGPLPSAAQAAESAAIGTVRWMSEPLDWLARSAEDVAGAPAAVRRIAREEDVDLLHLNLPSLAADGGSLPAVVVSHSCAATWFRAVHRTGSPEALRWQEDLNRSGFARADLVVAPSRSHAKALEDSYGALPRLTVVRNASGAGAKERPRRPFVLAVGRWWDEGKNGAVLDEAAALLSWPVRLVGATFDPHGARADFRHAEMLGAVDHEAVGALMSEAGIFCSPSLYEPFGLAALEAARAAAPLVLADIPTYRELWSGAALFADPRSPASFATALGRLARDETARHEFGRRARLRAERYALDAQRDAMLAVYAAALGHAPTLVAAE